MGYLVNLKIIKLTEKEFISAKMEENMLDNLEKIINMELDMKYVMIILNMKDRPIECFKYNNTIDLTV